MRGLAPVVCALLVAAVGVALHSGKSVAVAATRYRDPMFSVDVQRDVVYGSATTADGRPVTLLLDLYVPRGDAAADRPAFLFAHGGAFFTGDKSGSWLYATRLAERGYVAASINYRLGPTPVVAPVDSPYEVQTIENARADMQTAVRWMRANAASLRIDPDRIAVGGSSAGAVTALGVAVNADQPLPGDHSEHSSAVCTAVSIAGANDAGVIGPNDAGALFHHGTLDTVVPFAMAQQTRDAMTAAGLAVRWHEYSGEGHSLSRPSSDLALTRTIEWLYDTVATASFPCSPAVRMAMRPSAGTTTPIAASAARVGVVSLVAVDNTQPGWVQSLPCDATPGGASNVNADAAGQIRSSLAMVPFDSAGRSCLFNQMPTHLVADLQGYFRPGAFDDVADVRLLDTRSGERPAAETQQVVRGVPGRTAVVSLVATETGRAGYMQVLPCGAEPGATSNLNADAAGQTRAVLAFVRFAADGTACLYTQHASHLVVDLQGYLAVGAFDDIADTRVLDTRGGPRPAAAAHIVVHGRAGRTAVVSLVATETAAPGYVQVLPCGSVPGATSNLNVDAPDQTVAGLALVQFDAAGEACLFTQAPAHLVVDVQGYLASDAFDDIADVRLLDSRVR